MVVFLADRADVRARQLHRRVANRFHSDGAFEAVRLRVAEPREPGPYRVVARTDPRVLLDDDAYPVTAARIEVGFGLRGRGQHDHYWFNWVEPERDFLMGWHQDDDHPDLGPAHVQVNQGGEPIEHASASVVDVHPMAVVEARLARLGDALSGVTWDGGTVTGLGR